MVYSYLHPVWNLVLRVRHGTSYRRDLSASHSSLARSLLRTAAVQKDKTHCPSIIVRHRHIRHTHLYAHPSCCVSLLSFISYRKYFGIMKATLMILMLGMCMSLSSGLYVRRGQDPPKLPSEADIDKMSIGDSLNAIMNVVQHMKAKQSVSGILLLLSPICTHQRILR